MEVRGGEVEGWRSGGVEVRGNEGSGGEQRGKGVVKD